MTKKHLYLIAALAAVLVIAGAVVCWFFTAKTVSIEMDPVKCKYIFGCPPQLLVSSDALPQEIDYLKKDAHIAENGNLVFRISRAQLNKLKNSPWLTTFDSLVKRPNVEIFDNYTSLTLYYTNDLKTAHADLLTQLEEDLTEVIYKIRFREQLHSLPHRNTDYAPITFRIRDGSSRDMLYSEKITASDERIDLISLAPFVNQYYHEYSLTLPFAETLFGVADEDDSLPINEKMKAFVIRGTLYSIEQDENDQVTFFMSPLQKELWEKMWLEKIRTVVENSGASVPEGYTKVIIGQDGTLNIFDGFLSLEAIPYCAWLQILNGTKEEDISVEYIVGSEDNPYYQATWPKEEINMEFNSNTKEAKS